MINNPYKKKIIYSLVFLLLSVAVLTTAIFGWFSAHETPSVSPLNVKIISRNNSVNITVQTGDYGENEVSFLNMVPLDEHIFTVRIVNNDPVNPANYNIVFQGLSDNLAENEVYLDMIGIFMVDIVGDEEEPLYFREIVDIDGNIPIVSGAVPIKTTEDPVIETITFKLIFAGEYFAGDYIEGIRQTTDDPAIINAFQGKVFNIQYLIVTAE